MKDWTEPDKNGTIDIPDELMPLFKYLSIRLNSMCGISAKDKLLMIEHIVKRAHEFFKEHPELINE